MVIAERPGRATRLHGTLDATFYANQRAAVQTNAPLELRGPFARDGAPLHYLRNVTTGIFGGDRYDVSLRAEAGASVQVASSSATKAYAARGCPAQTLTQLEALPGARLVYGPHALILQEGASLQARTVATMHAGASLLLAEVLSFGRAAGGERLRFDAYDYELVVQDAGGAPLYEERYVLQPDESLEASNRGLRRSDLRLCPRRGRFGHGGVAGGLRRLLRRGVASTERRRPRAQGVGAHTERRRWLCVSARSRALVPSLP